MKLTTFNGTYTAIYVRYLGRGQHLLSVNGNDEVYASNPSRRGVGADFKYKNTALEFAYSYREPK